MSIAEDSDPFLWLEEVEGEKALTWVRAQNDRSLKILQADARYADLEAAIRAAHPYELPEIIAVPIARGLPGYLDWLVTETRAEAADRDLPT